MYYSRSHLDAKSQATPDYNSGVEPSPYLCVEIGVAMWLLLHFETCMFTSYFPLSSVIVILIVVFVEKSGEKLAVPAKTWYTSRGIGRE